MARIYNANTINILGFLRSHPDASPKELKEHAGKNLTAKDFANTLFRLASQELAVKTGNGATAKLNLTEDGKRLLKQLLPERDGIWKLVIFDIPEKQKRIRVILRAKLKALHFKKWQNSIWVSPYALDAEIEQELKELSKKFFIRLIKATDINNTDDLKKMFS
ncbi:MAG TPA: hypothetical protein VHA30_03160 [Patescibacteria group bacterium]|nr:hypothetical protein [Patescibacteria group bacterium]